jgi:hypothetical protein
LHVAPAAQPVHGNDPDTNMDPIISVTLRETLPALPPEIDEQERLLRRTTEACAARKAAFALDLAAHRGEAPPAAGHLLQAANTLLQNGTAAPAARETLRRDIASGALVDVMPGWVAELREIAATAPGSGACTVATALQLWTWTARHFLASPDRPHSVIGELADVLPALVAARAQILATVRPTDASSPPDQLLLDLCHVQAARAAGAVGTACAELVHGYRRHPAWDVEGCASCYGADELDEIEGLMPGFASTARGQADVIERDGSHVAKAGPCVRFNEIDGFTRLRAKLDGCLTGARLAGDRAAAALADSVAAAGNH